MKKSPLNSDSIIFEKGFSLVEILVAITITTILIGFASGIYIFGQRLFVQWQDRLFLQNELHTLSHGITEELFRADRIESLKPEKLVLLSEGKKKKYEVRNGSLLVNSQYLLNQSLSLVTFYMTAKDKENNVIEGAESKEMGNITFIEFKLALTNGEDTLQTTRSLHLRKPSNWNTLTSK